MRERAARAQRRHRAERREHEGPRGPELRAVGLRRDDRRGRRERRGPRRHCEPEEEHAGPGGGGVEAGLVVDWEEVCVRVLVMRLIFRGRTTDRWCIARR